MVQTSKLHHLLGSENAGDKQLRNNGQGVDGGLWTLAAAIRRRIWIELAILVY